MVQQIAISTPHEQRSPRESSGRPYAAVPDLIVAARRRLLPGAGARLRATVVEWTLLGKYRYSIVTYRYNFIKYQRITNTKLFYFDCILFLFFSLMAVYYFWHLCRHRKKQKGRGKNKRRGKKFLKKLKITLKTYHCIGNELL